MNRRDFIKLSATVPVVGAASSSSLIAAEAKQPILKLPKFENTEAYWEKIRAQFPITKELLYFNNGTMGPSPKYVTDIVTKQIEHVDATGDYGYDVEGLRASIGKFINADKDDIALTHNVSEGISIIAGGLEMMPGDEVILTNQEHGGGAVPWLARAKRHGIVVKFFTLEKDFMLTFINLKKLVTKRTRIVAIPHITCTTGHVLYIKQIAEFCHSNNIFLFVDGAHVPGMLRTDIKYLGCDAYASCGHKWMLGPKGTGFLYISKKMREVVAPSWAGAEADKHWDYKGNLEWLDTASKYDFGTQSSSLYTGLRAAIDWQEMIGVPNIDTRVQELSAYMREGLVKLMHGKFEFLTPPTSQSGITTIRLQNPDRYTDFANALQTRYKIRTRIVPEGDLKANRFSVHIYTSKKDIDIFLKGVADVLKNV
jgi:cysteine desulfurase / selenocysteine lyase